MIMTGSHILEIEEFVKKLCATGEIKYKKHKHFIPNVDLPTFILTCPTVFDLALTIQTYSRGIVKIFIYRGDSRLTEQLLAYSDQWTEEASAFVEKFFTEKVMNIINLSVLESPHYEKESILYVLRLMFPYYEIIPEWLHEFKAIGLSRMKHLDELVTGFSFSQFIEYDWVICRAD